MTTRKYTTGDQSTEIKKIIDDKIKKKSHF
jgi:hypothetical protein